MNSNFLLGEDKSMRFFILAMAVSAAAISSASSTIKFLGTNGGKSVEIKYNGNSKTVFAGKMNFKNLDSSTFFQTVCGDLNNFISGGQSWLVNERNATSVSASMGAAGNIVAKYFNAADNNEKKAALQLAVWEAVYDFNGGTNPNFDSGVFQGKNLSSSLKNQAKLYYMAVNMAGAAIYFEPQPSNAGQGQLGLVPEPATMAILGLGVAALARRRRK